MILRFLTLGNTKKLESDLFYLGAGDWHEHAKAEAPRYLLQAAPSKTFVR